MFCISVYRTPDSVIFEPTIDLIRTSLLNGHVTIFKHHWDKNFVLSQSTDNPVKR